MIRHLWLWDTICYPAATDLEQGSNASQAIENQNISYYTIYRKWTCYLGKRRFSTIRKSWITGSDDGLVPVSSVDSESYFINVGNTLDQHPELQTENEYEIAYPVLVGN